MRAISAVGLAVSLLAWTPVARAAEDEQVRRAREEVEREMQKLVHVPDGVVTLVWTGFEGKGYDVDEAHFELDGQPLALGDVSDLPRSADRSLFTGKLADGTHHLHVNLLLHRSNLSLLGGYRITQLRVNADIPFPAAQALSVPVRFGLHVDAEADDPKKKLVLKTDIKPVMLAAVDDSTPPPIVAPVTQVTAAAEVPPPPVVEAVAPEPAPKPEVAEPSEPSADARNPHRSTVAANDRPHVAASLVRDAGGENAIDAGWVEVDAGTPAVVDAGAPFVDAGSPAPPPLVIAKVPLPIPPPAELEDPMTKRILAGLLGLGLLIAAIVVLRRRDASKGA